MNIQSVLNKVYNVIKYHQLKEKDITAENFGEGAYMAGMLDSAKLFMKIYNGELSEHQIEIELARIAKDSDKESN